MSQSLGICVERLNFTAHFGVTIQSYLTVDLVGGDEKVGGVRLTTSAVSLHITSVCKSLKCVKEQIINS